MYVKCPHCGTSFTLEPTLVKDFGGWARCGACMQPFNSQAAALDALPDDDSTDVLVRSFDYADDVGHFEAHSGDAKKRSSFIVEPHSRSEIPGFLRVGEEGSFDEPATEDQAQMPLPLSPAHIETPADQAKNLQNNSVKLGQGFESPLVPQSQESAPSKKPDLSQSEAVPKDTRQSPSLTPEAEQIQSVEQTKQPDELGWLEQLEADIAAAENSTEGTSGDGRQTNPTKAVAVKLAKKAGMQNEGPPAARQKSSTVGSFDTPDDELVIDEELQMSSNIEPAVAAWPEEQVMRGVEPPDSPDDAEDNALARKEKRKYRGVGNIGSSSGAYNKVMSDKPELQSPRLWLAAIIIFSLIAVAQLVNRNKVELSQTVFGRPIVNLWCAISGCSTGELVQVGKIELVHTSVSAHDTEAGVLVVDVHLVSRTLLGQPHPAIQLTLTDRDGMPAARRIFTAQEYLASSAKNELAPNVITELRLEVADPPDDSVGFEVVLIDQR